MTPRDAQLADLPALIELEETCFEPERRADAASLRRSLSSRHQHVRVIEASDPDGRGVVAAASVLRCHPTSTRVYSIAVDPRFRSLGLGHLLMADAERIAREAGCTRLSLEADARNERLIEWYRRQGFVVAGVLTCYYGPGWDGVKMVRDLSCTRPPTSENPT